MHESGKVLCAHRDCSLPGVYPAPRSRDQLHDYYWFCLEHVRAYNRQWCYYDGMSPAGIEADRRADSHWRRPSWRMGHSARFEDCLEMLGEPAGKMRAQRAQRRPARPEPPDFPETIKSALRCLGVEAPLTLSRLKCAYRRRVKALHPDCNPSPQAGKRFAEAAQAYQNVRKWLLRNG